MLQGCSSAWVKLSDVERSVTVLEVNPPKRLYVTIRDDSNGHVYDSIYVSKRCGSYERVPVGSKFKMNFEVYENKETGEVSVEPNRGDLYQRFCG